MSRLTYEPCLVSILLLAGCGSFVEEDVLPPNSVDSITTETAPLSYPMPCDAPVVQQPGGDYAKLSDTGLYCNVVFGALDRNVRFFAPEFGLWADGAEKSRFMRIPPGAKIDTSNMDGWVFPVGMKVWKEFRVGGKKIETRLLEKRPDGSWLMIAYQWNDRQTDAFPVPDGVINANGTTHDIPPVAQCVECHSNVADALNGVSALMLTRASFWGVGLSDLISEHRLTRNPDRPIGFPGDRKTREALAYVYANCAHCHRGANAPAGLQWSTSVFDSRPEDTAVYRTAVNQPLTGWLGHGFTSRVVGGSPSTSAAIERMSTRVPGNQMPELATKVVDPMGIAIVSRWISQLR